MIRSKTNGGVGTNQYQIQGQSKTASDITPIMLVMPLPAQTERRAQLASWEGLDSETFTLLAQDDSQLVRRAVAQNLQCPTDILDQLTKDPDPWVRKNACGNLGSTIPSWTQISTEHPEVMDAVAGRHDCPTEILAKLVASRPRSRLLMINSPNCPPAVLEDIESAIGTDEIRQCVAGNPNTPTTVLDRLSAHADPIIRFNVASNPSCRSETLETLAADPQTNIREAVATRTDCPSQLFERFSTDGSVKVRLAVAAHPQCPPVVLVRLTKSKDHAIRAAILSNPQLPDHIRAMVVLGTNE